MNEPAHEYVVAALHEYAVWSAEIEFFARDLEFVRLAADALEGCGASRAHPLALAGIRERFLPDCSFRDRQNSRFQFAVLAAAAVHGEPRLTC